MKLSASIAIGVVVGLVVFTLASVLIPGSVRPSNLYIQGQVTDSSTGKPIAGATVVAISAPYSWSAATDVNGNYQIITLTTYTTFSVTAQATGYAMQTTTVVSSMANVTGVILENFVLASSGNPAPPPPLVVSIFGTVTYAASGKPAYGVRVTVSSVSGVWGTVYTDTNGAYGIGVANPGTYTVVFNLTGYPNVVRTVQANNVNIQLNAAMTLPSVAAPFGAPWPVILGVASGGVAFVAARRRGRRV